MNAMVAHEEAAAARREAEAKLAAMEDWDKGASRYALSDFGVGSFAYEFKPSGQGEEPHHRLCANCFTQSQKSILQFHNRTYDKRERWLCPDAKWSSFSECHSPAVSTQSLGAAGQTSDVSASRLPRRRSADRDHAGAARLSRKDRLPVPRAQ